MKMSKTIILILILAVTVQANPPRRDSHHRSHRSSYRSWPYSRHHNYYSAYGYYRYYSPVIVTTQSTTSYPSNLVVITADAISEDIVILNSMMSRGLISEKDYERAKKTLLNRIGMSVNPDAQEITTTEILDQIETLYQMHESQLLTLKEYKSQKKKLLARI